MDKYETLYLAGGCFWCTEAIFENIEGVMHVVSGYMGGEKENPSYQEVTTGATGHAETIQVDFDSAKVSVADLLEIFFDMHDPTSLNKQGADKGTQYRSAIFYTNKEQKEYAEKIIQKISPNFDKPIVTELNNAQDYIFYPAEDDHQHYYTKNSEQRYCQIVISPKLEKLTQHYKDRLKNNI